MSLPLRGVSILGCYIASHRHSVDGLGSTLPTVFELHQDTFCPIEKNWNIDRVG